MVKGREETMKDWRRVICWRWGDEEGMVVVYLGSGFRFRWRLIETSATNLGGGMPMDPQDEIRRMRCCTMLNSSKIAK